jgi:hypothetical protein
MSIAVKDVTDGGDDPGTREVPANAMGACWPVPRLTRSYERDPPRPESESRESQVVLSFGIS